MPIYPSPIWVSICKAKKYNVLGAENGLMSKGANYHTVQVVSFLCVLLRGNIPL